ncbi:ferrochelatase [Williamsia limnetica]|jgi:ferrochelatase|uniref:Coproporphyrin III ferrochelatase n=1 Tax=Williamsia limnetica TaxID=882452 RepID=A0A318RTA5_WILLI|nr:ferrochelatase [Williamsia limnetica]PYE20971.1 ferrochelatase [Williamsia limnetica]
MSVEGGFDAVMVLSFGGPDKPADVRPFLENVTRGRGVPPERLDEVAEHYHHFGGVSPINALNKQMIGSLETELGRVGIDLPVYFGNRNWHPMIEETLEQIYADGHRRVLVFPTSAWGGYSGCRQYDEDIRRGLDALGDRADSMVLRKLPQYWDHPAMTASWADSIRAASAELPPELRDEARLIFTAHSIPDSADRAAGPPQDGGRLYSRQVADASRLAATAAGFSSFDQVWQSRSGPARIPWLDPDICDHLDDVAAQGVLAVIVCPIGFVSDHLEVVWDLDNEGLDKANELGLGYARAKTVGTDPRFITMIVELIGEQLAGPVAFRQGMTDNGAPCAVGCCEPVRRPA